MRIHQTGIPSLGIKYSGGPLSSVQVSPECVWRQLRGLNPSKSTGPDHCHPRIFQEVAAASIPAVQKVIRRGSVAYSMKGSYGNSNF